MKKLTISPISNRIYYATVKELSEGMYMVTGKQEDMTEDVIKMAFSWFMQKYEQQEEKKPVSISYNGFPYCLTFTKKSEVKGENENE